MFFISKKYFPKKNFTFKKKMQSNNIIQKTTEFAKEEMKLYDPSHSFDHIERVVKLAKTIAQEEMKTHPEIDLEVIHLASLLHDVGDWKYSAKYETDTNKRIQKFLEMEKYPQDRIDRIITIVDGVSFKNELGKTEEELKKINQNIELCIVQDSDRLEAIGAIGVARCFCYSGKKNNPMYDPNSPPAKVETQQDYVNLKGSSASAINHFYEKLFKIKDMIKTETGKKMAEQRHQFMVDFVNQFYAEWDGKK